MFCPECGKKAENGDIFCSNCGTKLVNSFEIFLIDEKDKTTKSRPEVVSIAMTLLLISLGIDFFF